MATRSGNGFGPNPVSMSDICAYLEITGPPYLDGPTFLEMIISMDQRYTRLMSEKKVIVPGNGRNR